MSKESVDAFMAIVLVGCVVVLILGFIFWLIYHAYMELFRGYPYDFSPSLTVIGLFIVGVVVLIHNWYLALPDKILR